MSCSGSCQHSWDYNTGGDWKICRRCGKVEKAVTAEADWLYVATPHTAYLFDKKERRWN